MIFSAHLCAPVYTHMPPDADFTAQKKKMKEDSGHSRTGRDVLGEHLFLAEGRRKIWELHLEQF